MKNLGKGPGKPGQKAGVLAVATALVAAGILAPAQGAIAAPPPGQDFNVTQGDLEFIIKQIDISEDHAEATLTDPNDSPLCLPGKTFDVATQTYRDSQGYCVGSPTMPYGLRTVDGRWNNLLPAQDGYGTAQEVFPRLLKAEYKDADVTPPFAPGNNSPNPGAATSYNQTQGFVYDSDPRTISNLIVDQTVNNAAAVEVMNRVDGSLREIGATATRLAGTADYSDAVAISRRAFPDGAPVVYISRDDDYADAMTAATAAKADGAPLLMVPTSGTIPTDVDAELRRLAPGEIVVVGGPLAVSEQVFGDLGGYAATVTRVAGDTRFGTAVAISNRDHPTDDVSKVYLTTAFNFPDALTTGSVAARDANPVLLTNVGSMPQTTINELTRLAPSEIVIMGGPLAVDPAVETQVRNSVPGSTVTRIGGANRIETAAMLSAASFTPPVDTVYVVTGDDWPDAMAIAPVAGMQGAPVLLVRTTGSVTPVITELNRLAASNIVVIGANSGVGNVSAAFEEELATSVVGNNVVVPDIATDEGLSASATSLFTIFGQFFDHGLDLVSKGGNGTVVIPLQPDDPLYVQGARTNFLTLTRATINNDGGAREHINRTTPFVDQNQTYGSHASHQAFMREYTLVNGSPMPTGRILNGEGGEGLPTWNDVKNQARTVLGIELDDFDVLDVPLIATDPYGHLLLGANGRAQLAFADGLREGNPAAPISTEGSLTANASFLDDIAHGATPRMVANPADPTGPQIPGYDNASLGQHFITGDGRGNENIGLTSVHHVFHSEHNRMMDQIQNVLETEVPAELLARYQADGFWDYGERLFQAARFFTEMQYQHLVFEEFARRIQPNIDATVLNENSYQPDVNSSIRAEFAHSVYRFGHSLLRETVPREHNGVITEVPLLDAFLSPTAFRTAPDGTAIGADESAGGILKGLANQTANGIDEFVTDTLRNKLLGLPLDLPAINIARARDTGVPGMQAARATFFEESGDPQLAPYDSWEDFRLSMKNPESIGNFIAAYGNHPTVVDATTLAAKRSAGQTLATNTTFMNASAADSGLNEVDLWMGGLAEKPYIFGGMLGATFNYVFEKQLEDLQNGDRFYYLNRNLGNSLFHTLEANSLSQIVLRNTTADRVPHDVFASPQLTFNLDSPQTELNSAGLTGSATAGWRFNGAEHIVVQDTDAASNIRGGLGDDSIWGRGGNDRIEGDDGADAIMGGDGDDILTDLFGDDRIQGEAGNDAINGGPGVGDLLFGGSGQDYIVGGQDAATVFGGLGDDFIWGSSGRDNLRGDEGNDWIDGGNNADLLVGDLSNTMMNDPGLYHGGHDVTVGRTGNNDHDAEGGDDIMVGGPGTDSFGGMLGFDWVTYDGASLAVSNDMDAIQIVPGSESAIIDRFKMVEGFSGGAGNDVVRGNANVEAFEDPNIDRLGYGHRLTQEHLTRIEGLRDILGGGDNPVYAQRFMVDTPATEEDMNNNILFGGAGDDTFEPRAGSNFVDGDAWLDVNVVLRNADNQVTERQNNVSAYQTRIFNRTLNPADLSIERRLQNTAGTGNDTVVYAGPRTDYLITTNADGVVQVASILEPEVRTDYLRNVEQLQFGDGVVVDLTTPALEILQLEEVTVDPTFAGTPADGDTITTTLSEGAVNDGGAAQFELQVIALDGAGDPVAITTQANDTGEFGITAVEAGSPVQVIATITDGETAPQQFVSEVSEGTAAAVEPAPTTAELQGVEE
ncbi:peroxidase family protein [Arthrobacter sp. KK5.5]|uniref:peroxidase family protein n=1 Tax=Arthrobacter sp. KK5.5 TaxID=3373084 RepID=UPI003EE459D5